VTRERLVWALGVAALVLAVPAAYFVAAVLPLGYDFRAYWLAAQHLVTGAPMYESPTGTLGQPDEYHYLPVVAVPFLVFLLFSITTAAVVWFVLQVVLAGVVGVFLTRPLPRAVRPWAAAGYVFFLPMILEVTLGNVDLICIVFALLAWRWRERGNRPVIPYAAALGIKLLPLSLLPFYLAAGYARIVIRAFVLGLLVLVATIPLLSTPYAQFLALLPRYLDTDWARIHAQREEPAWLATIAWSDLFPLVLAIASIALAVAFGWRARREPSRATDWHHLALALSPYVTPFGFIWTTYLICALPLFVVTLDKALRLDASRRALTLVGLVGCWALMQVVRVHDLWPVVAHLAGVVGLIAIALLLMALESRQAEGRSTPLSRATRVASG
jgi:glycosyl transferase family 87